MDVPDIKRLVPLKDTIPAKDYNAMAAICEAIARSTGPDFFMDWTGLHFRRPLFTNDAGDAADYAVFKPQFFATDALWSASAWISMPHEFTSQGYVDPPPAGEVPQFQGSVIAASITLGFSGTGSGGTWIAKARLVNYTTLAYSDEFEMTFTDANNHVKRLSKILTAPLDFERDDILGLQVYTTQGGAGSFRGGGTVSMTVTRTGFGTPHTGHLVGTPALGSTVVWAAPGTKDFVLTNDAPLLPVQLSGFTFTGDFVRVIGGMGTELLLAGEHIDFTVGWGGGTTPGSLTVGHDTDQGVLSWILDKTPGAPVEVILDNTAASGVTYTGTWTESTWQAGYYGTNYRHDGNTGKGTSSVRFTPTLAAGGQYDVYIWYPANVSYASNVPVDIVHGGGTATVTVNESSNGGQWVKLGTWNFNAGTAGSVLIRTGGTNGYVIADAVKFTPV